MADPAIPTEAPRDLLDTICTRGRLMLATLDMDLPGPTILMGVPAIPTEAPRDLLDIICTRGRLMLATLDMDLPGPTILMGVPATPTEAPRDLLDTICTRERLMPVTLDMDLVIAISMSPGLFLLTMSMSDMVSTREKLMPAITEALLMFMYLCLILMDTSLPITTMASTSIPMARGLLSPTTTMLMVADLTSTSSVPITPLVMARLITSYLQTPVFVL